jgi:acyl carrier protein
VAATGRAPHTRTEEVLASLFADLLGLDGVDVDMDFFAHGGHSLLATRLTGRIRAALDVDVKVTTVFGNPTVARLATQVETLGASKRPRLARMIRQEQA